MYFKQFYLGCLAHGSYLLASEGEAAIVDPQRDVDQYIEVAKANDFKIKYIIETHLHADFVSGHKELAAKTGAEIIFGAKANAQFEYLPAKDGDKFSIGSIELKVLETPGHTPESICILATETKNPDTPAKIFTGDTLFIGDVGRPDLVASKGFSQQEMAGHLYDSLSKLSELPDSTEVYPAHGAGSLCGKHLSDERSSTIGKQKQFNYAFKPGISREAFINMVTTDLPEVPAYFPKDAELNRKGAATLSDLPKPKMLTAVEANNEIKAGAILLDVRSGQEFAAGHIKGSLNIGLGGQFASWAGTLIAIGTPIILLTNDLEALDEAVMRLARIGIESVTGYLADGLEGWLKAGFEIIQTPVISASDLQDGIASAQTLCILDVRRKPEFDAGHIDGATNIPLAELPERIAEIDREKTVTLVCASGYRSSIAKSVLERAELTNLMNMLGGMKAWKTAGLPTVTPS